jgi:hypothetical protein
MSRAVRISIFTLLCVSIFFIPSGKFFAKDQDLTPEQLIATHLKSIGDSKALAGIQSRSFGGTCSVHFIQGMNGSMQGQSVFVSAGPKMAIVQKFNSKDYPGEYFAYDGKEVTVQNITPGQKSPIAEFLFRYNGLMKEGLIGGVLSSTWPLLNINEKQVQLKYREATVEGRKLHMLEYRPKNGLGDVKIKLYFDPATYRHVRTEYSVRHREDASVANESQYTKGHGASNDAATAAKTNSSSVTRDKEFVMDNVNESIYKLVEEFDDFKTIGGVTLPHTYKMSYSIEGSGQSFIGEWKIDAVKWGFNGAFDDKIFQAQK